MNSLREVSTFIFKLGYGHPGIVQYPKYNIENVIGFYEISKSIYNSQCILDSIELKLNFNK